MRSAHNQQLLLLVSGYIRDEQPVARENSSPASGVALFVCLSSYMPQRVLSLLSNGYRVFFPRGKAAEA